MADAPAPAWFRDDIGLDIDSKPIPPQARWFDPRTHPCGCATVFSVDIWDSLTLSRCRHHARVAARNNGGRHA